MEMPSKLEVRRAVVLSDAEQQEIVLVLICAFAHDPFYSFIYPDTESRIRFLHWLFGAAVKDAVRFGRIDVAYRDKIVGVGINYAPGRYPLSFVRNMRCLPEYSRVAVGSPGGFVQLYRALVGLNKVRPARPHSYGLHLAGQQGEFTGAALMEQWLNDADANHWPCYLETNHRKMVKFYSRFGFDVLQDGYEVFPGAPLTWTMWRERRANA
jgi:hypothetical protein